MDATRKKWETIVNNITHVILTQVNVTCYLTPVNIVYQEWEDKKVR